MTRGGAAVGSLLGLFGLAAAAIIGVALASPHLRDAPTSLVVSAVTAAVAVVLMSFQPLWALLAKSRPQVFRLHWSLGVIAFALVGVHVAALVVLSPDDVWFAISPDGPTRARMAVLATAALAVVVALGVARRVFSWSGSGFAVLHSFFAASGAAARRGARGADRRSAGGVGDHPALRSGRGRRGGDRRRARSRGSAPPRGRRI